MNNLVRNTNPNKFSYIPSPAGEGGDEENLNINFGIGIKQHGRSRFKFTIKFLVFRYKTPRKIPQTGDETKPGFSFAPKHQFFANAELKDMLK